MDYLFCYLCAGILLAWAADGMEPIPAWQVIAIIFLWLPATVGLGIAARRSN